MAARFWQVALLVQLVFGGLAAMGVQAATGSPALGCLAAAAALLALQLGFVIASFLLGGPRGPASDARPTQALLRAVLLEAGCFALVQLEMALSRWRGDAPGGAPAVAAARPVLLIHGILCNGAVWRPLARHLHAAGFGPLRAIDLEPSTGDIAAHAPTVAAAVRELRGADPAVRVRVVAHSMGGLVARAALGRGDLEAVSCLVTIATPHHGSRLARFAPGGAARQMRPGSEFLAVLNAARPEGADTAVTSIFSPEDNLISPAESPFLAQARNVALGGLGHFGLLRSPRTGAQVLAALEAA